MYKTIPFSLWSGYHDGADQADGPTGQSLPESGQNGGCHDSADQS